VDDFFAIIKKEDNNIILETLNSYHRKLKFTSEMEENGKLPFLDANIKRNRDKISFDWYRKSLASGRIINYHSTQPKTMVMNTAKNFINKVLTISDEVFHQKNIEIIKDTLQKNSFPTHIINTLIKNAKPTNKKNPDVQNEDGNPKRYFAINYIPTLTDTRTMKRIIPTTTTRNYFAHKSNTTLRTLFSNTKSKTPIMEQSDVVYEISCKSCDLKYVGTTKRALQTRVNEHDADIKKGKQTTGLSQHINETKHTADLKNIKILDIERRESKRLMLESLRIQQIGEKSMNTKEDKNNTNSVYSVLL